MNNPLQTFRDILTDKGLIPAEIMADGNLHRCPTQTKPHKQNGAYIAHVDVPATLWWCNWENGEQGTFCTEEKQTLSVSELSAWRERQHSIQRQREAEYAERHAEAAQLARQEWNSARMCDANHPICAARAFRFWKAYGSHGTALCLFLLWMPQTICKVCNASILMEQSVFSWAARYLEDNSSFRGSRKSPLPFVRVLLRAQVSILPQAGRFMWPFPQTISREWPRR